MPRLPRLGRSRSDEGDAAAEAGPSEFETPAERPPIPEDGPIDFGWTPPEPGDTEPAPHTPGTDQSPTLPASEPGPSAPMDQPGGPTEPITAVESAIPGPGPGEPERTPAGPWRRRLGIIGAALALILIGGAAGYGIFELTDESSPPPPPGPAPTVVIEQAPAPEAAEQLGFPAFATRNTTRVGGSDPTADAAGVALASYPTFGGVGGPAVVSLAPADSWQAGLAAASLAADPISAPLLLGDPDEIPGFTAEALQGLAPSGIAAADDAAVIAIGDVATPDGLGVIEIAGEDPAELAKGIDRQRARLSGTQDPGSILVVSSEDPGFAMPAAAWAARSGDPILFATADKVPEDTLAVIERHPKASVYVLGPESVIGADAFKELGKSAAKVVRIEGDTPEENAIAFARFVDGGFGWNINDPGHGFTIANVDRPADAGAAASLAAGGKPGPLLVTEQSDEPSRELRNFLLDTKPGFTDDPTRAVYNHVWIMGDTSAISLNFQAQVDELTKLEPVARGAGVPSFGPQPSDAEPEITPKDLSKGDKGG